MNSAKPTSILAIDWPSPNYKNNQLFKACLKIELYR